MIWHCWAFSVGVGRKESSSTQRAVGESIIVAICDICNEKSGIFSRTKQTKKCESVANIRSQEDDTIYCRKSEP